MASWVKPPLCLEEGGFELVSSISVWVYTWLCYALGYQERGGARKGGGGFMDPKQNLLLVLPYSQGAPVLKIQCMNEALQESCRVLLNWEQLQPSMQLSPGYIEGSLLLLPSELPPPFEPPRAVLGVPPVNTFQSDWVSFCNY